MLLLLACLIYTLLPGSWAIRVIAVISHKILIQIKRRMKTSKIFVEHETGTTKCEVNLWEASISLFTKLLAIHDMTALDWCHWYFFQTTFCKAMLLNVALDRQGESFDFIRFFFSENDQHWRVIIFIHFWDLVGKYFQIIVALRSPLSLEMWTETLKAR